MITILIGKRRVCDHPYKAEEFVAGVFNHQEGLNYAKGVVLKEFPDTTFDEIELTGLNVMRCFK